MAKKKSNKNLKKSAPKRKRPAKASSHALAGEHALEDIFASIEEVRRSAKPLGNLTVKDLIEEGRR